METFKIFAQDRVHPLLRTFQLVFMKLWMSLVKVFFFRTFPLIFEKVRRSALESEGGTPVSAHPRRLLSTVLVSPTGS